MLSISALFLFFIFSTSNAQAQTASRFIPADFSFNKDLRYGETLYPDVNYLQYLLDQNKSTEVAAEGVGSMNDTSSYYGAKTKDAVSRFQALYADEILKPVGLRQPTGFFGRQTRLKANQLLAGIFTGSSTPKIASSSTVSVLNKDSFTAEEAQVISKVSAKVDKQLSKVSSQFVKQDIKSRIIAELKSSILRAKLKASLESTNSKIASAVDGSKNILQKSDLNIWDKIKQIAKNILSPSPAYAQTGSETPFGGKYLFNIQCTCASDNLNYIMDYSSNGVLALLYEPGQSTLYANYNQYGTYQLGSYKQTSQSCSIESGEDCTDIDADGIYGSMPGTGTSWRGELNKL